MRSAVTIGAIVRVGNPGGPVPVSALLAELSPTRATKRIPDNEAENIGSQHQPDRVIDKPFEQLHGAPRLRCGSMIRFIPLDQSYGIRTVFDSSQDSVAGPHLPQELKYPPRFGPHHFVPIADVSRCSKRCARTSAYSITSSARASSIGGTSRPSALAVLRLMTNSNIVGS